MQCTASVRCLVTPICLPQCICTFSNCDWNACAMSGNLDETIEYYKKHFGLKQLRYRDIPEVSSTSFCAAVYPMTHCATVSHKQNFHMLILV